MAVMECNSACSTGKRRCATSILAAPPCRPAPTTFTERDPNRALAVVGYSSDVETREELDAAPRSFVPNGTVRFDFPRATDDSLDSIRAIVGWTLLTVLAFWTPVAVVAYVLTS